MGNSEFLARLSTYLAGRFSTREQAVVDPEYREITLVVQRIWADRTDGVWMYAEQALPSSMGEPYRQCVYHVLELQGSVQLDALALPGDPRRFAGAGPDAFAPFSPTDLTPREGCTIVLEVAGAGYTGRTNSRNCRSDVRGAAYATSDMTIEADTILTWERGFDARGKQTWGPTRGPYVFRRVRPEGAEPGTEVVPAR